MNGKECITALKALAEPTRVRILRLLLHQGLGVGEIAERTQVSQYNVSKHLRILREAGLLEVEKRGKRRVYSVKSGCRRHLPGAGDVLDLDCCSFRVDRLAPCPVLSRT